MIVDGAGTSEISFFFFFSRSDGATCKRPAPPSPDLCCHQMVAMCVGWACCKIEWPYIIYCTGIQSRRPGILTSISSKQGVWYSGGGAVRYSCLCQSTYSLLVKDKLLTPESTRGFFWGLSNGRSTSVFVNEKRRESPGFEKAPKPVQDQNNDHYHRCHAFGVGGRGNDMTYQFGRDAALGNHLPDILTLLAQGPPGLEENTAPDRCLLWKAWRP